MQENGILLLDKPADMTSFGVVARIRRVLSERAGKRVKVGHTGTLDPFATGLMILVTGTECKNAGTYTKLDKVYEATVHLGATSTTGDTEGLITPTVDVLPVPLDEVTAALKRFSGEITQTPPIFSAIKVNGRRAYDLARKGEPVTMPARRVSVHSLELVSYEWPRLTIRAHVSSGTYIRSLAADIGETLGVGAYCSSLRRTKIADWRVEDAQTLADYGVN